MAVKPTLIPQSREAPSTPVWHVQLYRLHGATGSIPNLHTIEAIIEGVSLPSTARFSTTEENREVMRNCSKIPASQREG